MRSLYEIQENMASLTESGDPEIAHAEADALLIETLRYLADRAGLPASVDDLIASWRAVPKWYA